MIKVFGIGLSRTGTTSLHTAFTMLGYKSKHYPTSLSDFDTFDAATDATVALRYKYLDKCYNAKFILTVRDVNDWVKSIEWLFTDCANLEKMENDYRELVSKTRKQLYGTDQFDPDMLKIAYNKHVREVIDYFKGKKNLLIMNICGGDGWEKLCPFVGKDIPTAKFPKLNASKIIDKHIHTS